MAQGFRPFGLIPSHARLVGTGRALLTIDSHPARATTTGPRPVQITSALEESTGREGGACVGRSGGSPPALPRTRHRSGLALTLGANLLVTLSVCLIPNGNWRMPPCGP